MTSRTAARPIMLAALLAIPACDAAPAPEAASPPRAELALPISLNEVMVAMVNQAADPIWVAAWRNPDSEAAWRELERRALQLQVAGTLLAVPGTGPLDAEWTAEPAWQGYAARLAAAGASAVEAVRARDVDAISAAGDGIVEVCEACHFEFKPAIPTGGGFGELSPTAEDFEGEVP